MNTLCENCVVVFAEGVLTDWNLKFLGVQNSEEAQEHAKEKRCANRGEIHIIEENPLEQIYSQLRALTSRTVEAKSVEQYDGALHTKLSKEETELKAEGVF